MISTDGVDGRAVTAAELGVPEVFNAAAYFVDRHAAEGRGAKIAIECGDERVTYAEVAARVNRVGSALRARLGVRRADRIVLLLHDTPAFAYAFFGAIKIGAVPIPINTLWKAPDYESVLDDSRARVLVVTDALLGAVLAIPPERRRALEHIIVVGAAPEGTRAFDDLLAAGSPDLEAEPTSRDDPAFWLYSSGSTGTSKGCVHLQHDMVVCARLYAQAVLGLTEADRCFSVAKLFFAYGLGNGLYFPFSVGATTILWPGPPSAANVYAVIDRHRPTLFYSVPTGYGMLLAHHGEEGRDFDLSAVRWAVSAGEALPPALYARFKERFGIDILDAIGSTEALHMFIANRPGGIRPGSSGTILDGYAAKIVDEEGRPVPDGEIGNLWISGDSTCAEYWGQPEKSRNTIQDRWLRTGDKYYRDADGFYWYAGRADDMLKVGGLWVSPIEVENTLLEHAAVLECAVVARADRDTLVKPAACVVLREGYQPSPEFAAVLQQFVRTRLPEYKRPRWVEFVEALPKTATGKIQRFKLRS